MGSEKSAGGESPAKTEQMYSVRLNHEIFRAPAVKGKVVAGVLYQCGDRTFEANTEHIVPASELPKFRLNVYPKRERGQAASTEFMFDPHLTITPIKQTE